MHSDGATTGCRDCDQTILYHLKKNEESQLGVGSPETWARTSSLYEALSGYKMLAGLPMDCRPVPHSFAFFANEWVH